MTIKNALATLCFIFLFASFTQAQSTTGDIVKEWERAKAYTKEYLDAMPDSGYSFKPTPEMRSFAEQILHLTDANYGFGSAATGKKSRYGMGELEKQQTSQKRR